MMQNAQALAPSATALAADSIGSEARARLRGRPRGASVYSSYAGAINIGTELGLVCIVPREVGRGPLNITVDGDFRLLSCSVASGDPVNVEADRIRIGSNVSLSLASTQVYDPPTSFLRPIRDREAIHGNISLARRTALVGGRFTGMGSLLNCVRGGSLVPSRPGLNLYSSEALFPLRALLRGLAQEKPRRVRAAATEVAGLGVGLTPSGDDLIAGLLLTLALGARNGLVKRPLFHRTLRSIAQSTKGRSSVLGQEYIEQASVGRANEKVRRLVDDTFTGAPQEVVASASDLITMGHSSGTDTLVGVLLGASFVTHGMPRTVGEVGGD